MSSLLHSATISSSSVVSLPVAGATFSSPRPLFSPPSVWLYSVQQGKKGHFDVRSKSCAISKSRAQAMNGFPVIKRMPPWEDEEDDNDEESLNASLEMEINERVKSIKLMLESIEDGEVSPSAYDTSWVAMVQDMNGSGRPQFPECLEWIANNQLPDGSWGDNLLFQTHDRILNTLACIIALAFWNIHPEKCQQGLKFFNENLNKLEEENMEHMPIGFEVTFPSLIDLARRLGIDVPHDSPIFKRINAARDIKLKKIPLEVLHTIPTSLLYSLEGIEGLDWERLMKLQNQNGSFLYSTSSTAYALSQTNDPNCLAFLTNIVDKFHGGGKHY